WTAGGRSGRGPGRRRHHHGDQAVSAPGLDPPHDAILAACEAMALAGFEKLAGGAQPAFAGLPDWLAQADTRLPLRRIADGFLLAPADTALIALLFAAALSEPVA